jgi:hypothetical protein
MTGPAFSWSKFQPPGYITDHGTLLPPSKVWKLSVEVY